MMKLPLDFEAARRLLVDASQRMYDSGRPLMRRILPDNPHDIVQWEHYPDRDVVNGPLKCRWFYHCHPPEERGAGEHGHFHLFVDKCAIAADVGPLVTGRPDADSDVAVAHIAGLSISPDGLPLEWFTVNRWVTDEWLYPAASITAILPQVSFHGRRGDGQVNRWLTAMVALYRAELSDLLIQRDAILLSSDISGDDKRIEITSRCPVDLMALFAG
jgi:hypothetical protein